MISHLQNYKNCDLFLIQIYIKVVIIISYNYYYRLYTLQPTGEHNISLSGYYHLHLINIILFVRIIYTLL